MKLRFAFAVNQENKFQKNHFGDAHRYLIYALKYGKITLISAETNKFRLLDEKVEHGSVRKGKSIIEFLKSKNVNVLVSTQFGKNIKLVNKEFIPVKVPLKEPEEVLSILTKHMHWIEDEWKNKSPEFKLFTISSGILKSNVNN